jgi:hypothetical protein
LNHEISPISFDEKYVSIASRGIANFLLDQLPRLEIMSDAGATAAEFIATVRKGLFW